MGGVATQAHPVDPCGLEQDCEPLPPEVEALRRAHRIERETAWDRVGVLERTQRRRTVCEGLGIFAAVEIVLACLSGWRNVALSSALPLGGVVGLLWFRSGAGILLSPVIAMLASLVHQGLLLRFGGGTVFDLLLTPFMVGLASAYLGMQREFGRPR